MLMRPLEMGFAIAATGEGWGTLVIYVSDATPTENLENAGRKALMEAFKGGTTVIAGTWLHNSMEDAERTEQHRSES